MTEHNDRVVLVTGASGSLGYAIVRAFQHTGARLVLADRDADRLPSLYPDLVDDEVHFFCPQVDATDEGSVELRMHEVYQRFGRIDVLANAVGGYRAGTPLWETPSQTWDFMMNLNARTAYTLSRVIVPYMLEQGSGKIIHISARAGLRGIANAAAYTASKSALIRLVESLADEVKMAGINVNCILPGTIDTPPNRSSSPDADFSSWVAPEAIADVCVFLASDAARSIHGAAIPVYGLS